MTIDDVRRLPGTGNGKYAQGAGYTIPFEVYFSAGFSEAALRLNSDPRLPKIGDTLGHESGAIATDTSVYADQVDISLRSGSLYSAADTAVAKSGIALYVVKYQQLTPQFAVNPLSRIDIEWGGSEETETVKYDVNGQALINSAFQLYSSLPQRPIRGSSVIITIRSAANPSALVEQYSYSTNATAIWGVAAENGLMGKICARFVQEGAVRHWEITFPIKFRRDSWRLKVIDNGYSYLDDDGKPQSAHDDVGQLHQVPVLLDGSGAVLPLHGTPVIYPSPATVRGWPAEGYEINDKEDWSGLGLPNPFTYA